MEYALLIYSAKQKKGHQQGWPLADWFFLSSILST